MRSRALLCPRNCIRTAGYCEMKSSGQYDVLKIIGSEKSADLSPYSEIVLYYQYSMESTDQGFMDFVRKNKIHLKNAVLVFDLPMEVMEEIGIERSIGCIRSIVNDVFENDDVPLFIHGNSNTPVLTEKLSEQLNIDVIDNRYWKNESGHVALLNTYYLDEIAKPSLEKSRYIRLLGIGLIIVGAVLLILRISSVIPSDTAIASSAFVIIGIGTLLADFYASSRKRWKE